MKKLISALCLSALMMGAHTAAAEEELSPAEKQQRAMVENHVEAPAFTLPDLLGKDVSLSQFKGKWVVLDFWGSWCYWCVKGIPEMKASYELYHPKGLEIIGIDCGDTREAWKEAVAKYELPWINVYNGDKYNDISKAYAVPGFPTKVIVDPEGKIYEIVVGEDPVFYETLSEIFK